MSKTLVEEMAEALDPFLAQHGRNCQCTLARKASNALARYEQSKAEPNPDNEWAKIAASLIDSDTMRQIEEHWKEVWQLRQDRETLTAQVSHLREACKAATKIRATMNLARYLEPGSPANTRASNDLDNIDRKLRAALALPAATATEGRE